MPYILQEDRPFYNAVVFLSLSKIQCGRGFDLKTEIRVLAKKLISVDLLAQDGQLNYFITKLCIEAGFLGKVTIAGTKADILQEFLINLLRKVYPRKYVHYNRAVGMLTCCGKEFMRIFGEEGAAIQEFLDYIADCFYEDVVGPYEDEKIKANGKVKLR